MSEWRATAKANATTSQVLEALTHPDVIRRWSPVDFELDDFPGCRLEAGSRGRVIGPDKKVKLVLVYPMTTGRNFDEVLRVIDSLQLTANHKVATPAQWKQGDDVIIAGSVSDEEARKTYPQGWQAPRPYIRIVAQPS